MSSSFVVAESGPSQGREVAAGARFRFGRNWARFLRLVDNQRIEEAERSLQAMLGCDRLDGKHFLDAGCGSGLFSLAAHRLGATVHSFDFDPDSVACTRELKRRYGQADSDWTIEEASALDARFMETFRLQADIVYSWGVLHHTGSMWKAIDLAASTVAPGGQLFIALYNRQQVLSRWWLTVKKTYNRLPTGLQPMFVFPFFLYFAAVGAAADLVKGRNPVLRFTGAGRRGMSIYRDTVDWVGGLPFEVASPGEVVAFCRARGLDLEVLRTVGGRHGCNEYLLRRLEIGPLPGWGDQRASQ